MTSSFAHFAALYTTTKNADSETEVDQHQLIYLWKALTLFLK